MKVSKLFLLGSKSTNKSTSLSSVLVSLKMSRKYLSYSLHMILLPLCFQKAHVKARFLYGFLPGSLGRQTKLRS